MSTPVHFMQSIIGTSSGTSFSTRFEHRRFCGFRSAPSGNLSDCRASIIGWTKIPKSGEQSRAPKNARTETAGASAEPAAASQVETISSTNKPKKGKGKGKSKDMTENIRQYESMNKMKLLETLVTNMAIMLQIHDNDIRDLIAVSQIMVFIAPESHPAVGVLRARYTDYIEGINKQKEELSDGEVLSSVGPSVVFTRSTIGAHAGTERRLQHRRHEGNEGGQRETRRHHRPARGDAGVLDSEVHQSFQQEDPGEALQDTHPPQRRVAQFRQWEVDWIADHHAFLEERRGEESWSGTQRSHGQGDGHSSGSLSERSRTVKRSASEPALRMPRTPSIDGETVPSTPIVHPVWNDQPLSPRALRT